MKTAEVTNTLDAKYFEILEYDLFLPLPVYLNEQVLSEFRVAEAKSHIVHETDIVKRHQYHQVQKRTDH